LRLFAFSALALACQIFACKHCLQIAGLKMHNVTIDFLFKKFADELKPFTLISRLQKIFWVHFSLTKIKKNSVMWNQMFPN